MSRFKTNIAHIAGGNIASQAILFGATPILTRLYSPEDFGVYAIFAGWNAVAAATFTLKFDLAILLPQEASEARDVTRLTVLCAVAFAIASALALVALGFATARLPPLQYLFLPASGLLAALYAGFQQWSARAACYRRYSQSVWIAAVITAITSCALGAVLPITTSGLLVGFVVGQSAAVLFLAARARPRLWPLQLRGALSVAGAYRRFPFFVLPSTLFALLGTSLTPTLVERLFTLHDTGQYALAARVLLTPSALIGVAIGEAFRAELMARLHRRESVTSWVLALVGKTTLLALLAFLAVAAVAPVVFGVVFGDAFREAGEYVRLLTPAALGQFVVLPLYFVFVATGRVRLGMVVQLVASLLPLALLAIGERAGTLSHALALYSGGSIVAAGAIIFLAALVCRTSDRGFAHEQ